ncbi:GrpB family protein [Lysinibacillus sp. NPDC096418]|uniref:GrpB family protein n=1 Tax=Lysinibacillus sp. NPDC096418 TaxID=3364138 RepID=UPI00380ECD08
MEQVNFFENSLFKEKVEKTFLVQKKLIHEHMPEADVQHVGSTAVPHSLTKGDLDIQVRVTPELFLKAVQTLSKLYDLNEGSVKTDSFRAFKDDSTIPPLGVQLTIIDSEYDFFWKFRDVLILNDIFRVEYDELKIEFEGKEMDEYRVAKNEFFQKIMATPEFNEL